MITLDMVGDIQGYAIYAILIIGGLWYFKTKYPNQWEKYMPSQSKKNAKEITRLQKEIDALDSVKKLNDKKKELEDKKKSLGVE